MMVGLMSISGLASGLQTDSILAQLEQLARAPILRLEQRKTTLQSQKTAWEGVNTRLLGIRDRATLLSKLNEQLTMSAAVSDGAANNSVTATTNAAAVAGNYAFTVNSVASYHQLATGAFADTDTTPVGTGQLVLTLGEKSATIDLTGKTLADLRNAINEANLGINAAIISQGSTFRLFLNSQTMGTTGAMRTDGSDAAALEALGLITLQEARDTVLTFGSGAEAFQVTRAARTLTDVIAGVTLNFTAAAAGKEITLNVTPNYGSATGVLQELVNQYNAFVDLYGILTKFDTESKDTGTLFGDSRLRTIYNDMASLVTGSISGATGAYNSLAQIGITLDKTGVGKLTIDQAVLDEAVSTRLDDVTGLFRLVTSTTHAAVTYTGLTHETRSSTAEGFAIALTQVATRATITLGAALPDALGQDETLTLNNIPVTLTQDMTPEQVVEAINSHSSRTRVNASLGGEGGRQITLTAMDYGSTTHLRLISNVEAGTPNSTGIGKEQITDEQPGDGNIGQPGMDVAGTINGEAATGDGRYLTGSAGAARGVKLLIATDELGDGDFGRVVVSRGLGSQLEGMLNFLTDLTDGAIKATEDSLQLSMDSIDEDIANIDQSVQREQERLRAQFTAMELALSKLHNQGAQLTAQLSQLTATSIANTRAMNS